MREREGDDDGLVNGECYEDGDDNPCSGESAGVCTGGCTRILVQAWIDLEGEGRQERENQAGDADSFGDGKG